ncbi:hypothetical protein ACFL54_08795 [Planctomycetota bacterium]
MAQPIRVAVTGSRQSAGLFETLKLMTREQVLYRINYVLENLLTE